MRALCQRGDALSNIMLEADRIVPTIVAMLPRVAGVRTHKRTNNCLDNVVKARKLHRPTSSLAAGQCWDTLTVDSRGKDVDE